MVRALVTVILLVVCVSGFGQFHAGRSFAFIQLSGSSSTLNDSLVSYWKMDETSGTRVDSETTGTAQDLTDNNTVGYTNGIIGNAAYFVAANSEYLSKTSASDIDGGQRNWSLAFWYKDNGGAVQQSLFNHGLSRSAPDYDYYIYIQSAKYLTCRIIQDSDGTARTATSAALPTNVLIFAVVVYSTNTSTVTIYTNGVAGPSATVT